MSEMYIVGKIRFDSNDDKGTTHWVVKEHKGMFKPKGTIKITLDKQAALDFENEPIMEKLINNLNGKRIRIIID